MWYRNSWVSHIKTSRHMSLLQTGKSSESVTGPRCSRGLWPVRSLWGPRHLCQSLSQGTIPYAHQLKWSFSRWGIEVGFLWSESRKGFFWIQHSYAKQSIVEWHTSNRWKTKALAEELRTWILQIRKGIGFFDSPEFCLPPLHLRPIGEAKHSPLPQDFVSLGSPVLQWD